MVALWWLFLIYHFIFPEFSPFLLDQFSFICALLISSLLWLITVITHIDELLFSHSFYLPFSRESLLLLQSVDTPLPIARILSLSDFWHNKVVIKSLYKTKQKPERVRTTLITVYVSFCLISPYLICGLLAFWWSSSMVPLPLVLPGFPSGKHLIVANQPSKRFLCLEHIPLCCKDWSDFVGVCTLFACLLWSLLTPLGTPRTP